MHGVAVYENDCLNGMYILQVFFFCFCFLGYVRTINSLYKYISFFIEENSYGLLSMKRLQVRKHIHIYLHTTVTTNSGSSVGIWTRNPSALVQITDVRGHLKNINQNFSFSGECDFGIWCAMLTYEAFLLNPANMVFLHQLQPMFTLSTSVSMLYKQVPLISCKLSKPVAKAMGIQVFLYP